MGNSDKAFKIITVAALASIAAYLGYRAYKKRYPFEESITKTAPINPTAAELETNSASNHNLTESSAEFKIILENCCESNEVETIKKKTDEKFAELADKCRLKGNLAFKDGDIDLAIKCYNEAIELYPNDHQDLALTYANRAACYLKWNRFDAVIDDCNKSLSIKPEFVKALDRRSKAFENLGRLEDALVDVTAACIIDDFKTSSLVGRVESILQTLSTENAQKDFETKGFALPSQTLIEEFFSTFPTEWTMSSEFSSNSALFEAIEFIKSKKYVEAAAICEAAVKSDVFRAKSLALQGSIQFIKGDMKSAFESLSLSHQLDTNDSNVLIKLALVELERNNYLMMHQNLEKAHDIDPKNPALFYHRGEIFALGGNLEQAVKDFETAISLYPDFVLAYVHKARALLGLEKYLDAEDSLNQAKEKFSDRVEVLNSLGEVLVMKKEYDAAEKLFNSILKKHPKSPEVYLNKALLAMTRNNDVKSAEKHLKRAIEIEPSFEAAHLQLANLLLSNGNVKDSMAHFEQAVKYARTLQELISVHSLKCASVAQLKIAEKFPSLADKMKALNQTNY